MDIELLISKGGTVAIILLALSVYGFAIFLLKLYHFQSRKVLFGSNDFITLRSKKSGCASYGAGYRAM